MNNTLRVVRMAVLAGVASAALSSSTFAAAISGVNLTNTITASMDGGITKIGDAWYEVGVNATNLTSGIRTGLISAQSDPLSTYLLSPANGLNVLMLDTNRRSGSLIFDRPVSALSLSLAAASGNGVGTVVPTLRFTDGTTDTLGPVKIGDWFNNTNRIETSNGRINVTANTFDNMNSDNPRILANPISLSSADAAKQIFAVDFSWTGQNEASSGNTTHTAIFGISGDVTGIGHFAAIPLDSGSFNQDVIVGLAEVPEPGTIALFGMGLAGLVGYAWRKRS